MFSFTRSQSWSWLRIKNSRSWSRPKQAGSETMVSCMFTKQLTGPARANIRLFAQAQWVRVGWNYFIFLMGQKMALNL